MHKSKIAFRQLVQKLKKDTKVETQHPSSHSNGNTHVVRSPNFLSSQYDLMHDFSFKLDLDSIFMELSKDAIITEGKCFIKNRSI